MTIGSGNTALTSREGARLPAGSEMVINQDQELDLLDPLLPDDGVAAQAVDSTTGIAESVVDATFANVPREIPRPGPLPTAARLHPASSHFTPLQSWSGVVVSVSEESFTADLAPATGPRDERLTAEFSLDDLDSTDRTSIAVGSEIFWAIGYLITDRGSRIRASIVQARRAPRWTDQKLQRIDQEAEALRELFDD